MNKHQILFFLLLLFGFQAGKGQYLDVPFHNQQQGNWCWAASVEMVFDFHQTPNISQCDIALSSHSLRYPFYGITDCCPSSGFPCNYTLGSFNRKFQTTAAQFHDQLFAKLGYNSQEEVETHIMDTSFILKELASCRPFMISLNKLAASGSTYDHTVVVKGIFKTPSSNYILVNDPQSSNPIGTPLESIHNIDNFIAASNSALSVIRVIRNIHPRDSSDCSDCTKLLPIKDNPLIAEIYGNQARDFPTWNILKSVYSNAEIKDLLQLKSQNGRAAFVENTLIYQDHKTKSSPKKVIISTADPFPTASLLDKNKAGEWIVKSISSLKKTPFRASVFLNFSGDRIRYSADQFEVIEYMLDFFQFYKIKTHKGIKYTPVYNYPNLPFKTEQAYSEGKVNKVLKKIKKERAKNHPLNKKPKRAN